MASVHVPTAGRRRGHRPAAALHARGDGPRPHGAQPVQGAAHGAAGGRALDRDDQVSEGGSGGATMGIIYGIKATFISNSNALECS